MASQNLYDEISLDLIKKDEFKNNYEELLKLQHIGTRKEATLSLEQIKFLLESASVFAFAQSDNFKQIAYKISTIISERYSKEYGQINQIVQYIIISSGQLPVIQKNTLDGNIDYFSTYQETNIPFNPFLFKNVILKQACNLLPIRLQGKKVFLTDFQSKAFYDLVKGKSISLSAPTSAGKSFLLNAFLSKKFNEESKLNVIYLVPTRALISQVQRDFKNSLKDFGIKDVLITSSSSSYNKERIVPKKIFILTQERFHNLLYDTDFEEHLHILIIDEAQKVSDSGRGIILEEVIGEAIKRNVEIQKIFISPFSKNPEKFAKMFHLEDLETEKTKLSPVSQNILRLDVETESYKLKLSTVEFDHEIEIHEGGIKEEEIQAISEIKDWPLLWAAKKFSSDFNIIYCNSTEKCVDYAVQFSSSLPEYSDAEVEQVISFLKEHIHKDYFLINCLKKGVAYHYGKMPNQIRELVENLFRNKKLKYIFCTSTLLEGVNLPAKNIFISQPKQGRIGMNRLSFWNLAGRAGRLLKDYYGNIFCINVEKWPGYKPDPKDMEHEIESILESTVINKDKEIFEYLKNIYFDLKGKDAHIEQAVTKFIIQEMKSGKISFVEDLFHRNPLVEIDKLKAMREEIQNIAKSIEIPAKIIQKNSSIDPRKQQELLEKFRKNHPIIPLHPTDTGSFNNLKSIYKLIDEFFLHKFNNSHQYLATLTFNWINDKSISELINFKIKGLRIDNEPTIGMINNGIEELFVDLNDKIMFEYQKFLKCYIDILLFFYEEAGYDSNQICDNLPMYLEYGTFKKNIMILQSIGLSRSTAISVNSLIRGNFSDENDCILWIKQNIPSIRGRISPILMKELEVLI